MMTFSPLIIFAGLLHLVLSFQTALAAVNLDDQSKEVEISKEVSLTKVSRDFNLNNVAGMNFVPNAHKTLNLGYNNDRYLAVFSISNQSENKLERYVYLNAINGFLELYQINPDQSLQFLHSGGTDRPKLSRVHQGIFGAIPFSSEPKSEVSYLLSVTSRHNVNANIFLGDRESLENRERLRLNFLGFYAGGILLLIIYNFFLFLMLKERVYLLYCFFASSFMLTSLVIHGQLDHLFPYSSFTFSHYLICFSSLSLFTATLFTFNFLEVKRFYPKLTKIYYGYLIVSAFIFISGLLPICEDAPRLFGMAIDIAIASGLMLFIFTAIKLLKKVPVAKFYLIAWGLVLLSVMCWFGMTFGVLKINIFTQNALAVGSMLEMLMLALALAYKIEILNQEKLSALDRARDKDRYARLVRVLSHDVANSLTVVSSYSKKIAKHTSLDETSRLYAEKVIRGTENIKNILSIVRRQETLVTKNQALDLLPTNVLECVEFSLTLYEEAIVAKDLQVLTRIPNDLFVLADKTCFINNIINNLLSNAIKFSYPDSQIEIYSSISDDNIYVHFKDYGVGIKNHLINDIFYSSKVVSTSGTNNETGHGLGSSLAREYMLLFGGKIQVTSQEKTQTSTDHGTLVTLIFPKIIN